MSRLGHLARRFAGSLSRREPAAGEVAWAHGHLLAGEQALWDRLSVQDRRHSLLVARRFESLAPGAGRAAMAGALLHDIGKVACGLGTFGRVVATIVGPRGRRFRRYHEHETIGVALLRDAGSDDVTLGLVAGNGALADALRAADDL